jgi:DMSO/TMAO reductase YedYZ molybdopterin-dependent catalytic subunit
VTIDPKQRVEKLKRANPKRKPNADPENRIPPGQYLTDKFPVLTHGPTPKVNLDRWQGVAITEVIKHIGILKESKYVMVYAYGGYTTNLPLVDLIDNEVLFAHSHNGYHNHGDPWKEERFS